MAQVAIVQLTTPDGIATFAMEVVMGNGQPTISATSETASPAVIALVQALIDQVRIEQHGK